jgi:FtsZ-binding cell division protein ZapB
LDGYPFNWKHFSLSTLASMIDVFKLSSLKDYVKDLFSLPNDVHESIQLLNKYGALISSEASQHSISMIAENIMSISFGNLCQLSIEEWQLIFSSDKLRMINEDFLLDLIMKLIKDDPNKKALLKNVKFQAVSSQLMSKFLEGFYADDLDFDLFEQLKTRLCCEVLILDPNSFKGRLTEIPINPVQVLTSERQKLKEEKDKLNSEMNKIILERNKLNQEKKQLAIDVQHLYQSNRELNKERSQLASEVEKVKKENNNLSKEKNELSSQVRQLNDKNEKLNKKNSEFLSTIKSFNPPTGPSLSPTEFRVNLDGYFGIISFLRQKKPNSVVAFASSTWGSSDEPKNVFIYDEDNLAFCSKNESNSWICFHFKHHKIVLSGYLLRSGLPDRDSASPFGWKLEGSNDKSHWSFIDS